MPAETVTYRAVFRGVGLSPLAAIFSCKQDTSTDVLLNNLRSLVIRDLGADEWNYGCRDLGAWE